VSVSKDRLRGAAAPSDELYATIEDSADFRELRRKFRGFAFPVTALFLAWYLLYVVASGWFHGFMGTKLWGNINVAYVFGLLQFVTTFLIAWLYWRHADRQLDPLAARIRGEIEEVDGKRRGRRRETVR
jgi:uncharacterized membrane protein (DUF485 family)